jgi:integrase/recombinase XerD
MATLFKPTRPYPLPAGAEIVEKDGSSHARVRVRGKAVLFPLTADRTAYLKPAAKWAAEVRFADGTRKRVRFSPNRDAAALMLAELLRKIERQRAGVHDQYGDGGVRPVPELLAAYRQHHADRGNTAKQAEQTSRRCEKVAEGCGFVFLRDLNAAAAERWLGERRSVPRTEGGFGAQTHNHYVTALKALGNWLVKSRQVSENPFRHLGKVNVEVDIRHERRPLTAAESVRLLAAAAGGGVYRKLAGPNRRMLYLVGGATGLRASELASLTPAAFALDADPPVVVVEAAYSKHRRRDEVPLHPDLVPELAKWLAGKPAGAPVWPGKWAKHNEGCDMIRRDLGVARAAWIGEAVTPEEQAGREESDFLVYRDRDGRVADFHAIRHTFVTDLVRAGVSPKDAKELARHSTITLTMDRYSHVTVKDTAAAVARLTLPIAPELPPGDGATKAGQPEGPGAATGAAAGGDDRGEGVTDEESAPHPMGSGWSMEPLKPQGVEDERGGSETGEESTPSRSRTCNLRFRRSLVAF